MILSSSISGGGQSDMNRINQPLAGMRASAAMIVIVFGAIGMMPASSAWSANTAGPITRLAAEPSAPSSPSETDEDDNNDVPTSQVDKYISVYESMQKDHNLTVEQAASKQGLTVEQFRNLENKIENDDALRERVRKALRQAANPNAKESEE
jgi:hypothetical protein